MKWKEHTSTDKFATDFAAIIQNQELDNDQCAARVEIFLSRKPKRQELSELAGVINTKTQTDSKNNWPHGFHQNVTQHDITING